MDPYTSKSLLNGHMTQNDVVLTSIRRHFGTKCPLGYFTVGLMVLTYMQRTSVKLSQRGLTSFQTAGRFTFYGLISPVTSVNSTTTFPSPVTFTITASISYKTNRGFKGRGVTIIILISYFALPLRKKINSVSINTLNSELNDLRKIICLRKSEISFERILVRSVIENLRGMAYTVSHAL